MSGVFKPIVILNAPPNAGKDMLAEYILGLPRYRRWKHMQFKDELYQLAAQYYGLELSTFTRMCTHRKIKDKPNAKLGGITPRQALIHVSEDEIKPTFGDEYFGIRAASRIKDAKFSAGFLFTDGGFPDELVPLRYIDGHKVFVIRVLRTGCSFDLDSREYLPQDYTLVNSTKRAATKQLQDILQNILMNCHGV